MAATRFKPLPGPPLAEIGLRAHDFHRGAFGRCRHCEMPKRNRVHDPVNVAIETGRRSEEATEWARVDAARLGERDW